MTHRATFWNNTAEKYAKTPISNVAAYELTLERTRSYLGPNDQVLELGCGTGSTAITLAPMTGHITATDLSDGMIRIGQRKATAAKMDNVTFAVRDIMTDTGVDDTFDVILGFNLFHLVPDMERDFCQIGGMLPKGGFFISKTACLGQSKQGLKGVLIRLMIPALQLIGKAPFVRSFSIAQLEAAITDAGFDIVECGQHAQGNPPSQFIVARKR